MPGLVSSTLTMALDTWVCPYNENLIQQEVRKPLPCGVFSSFYRYQIHLLRVHSPFNIRRAETRPCQDACTSSSGDWLASRLTAIFCQYPHDRRQQTIRPLLADVPFHYKSVAARRQPPILLPFGIRPYRCSQVASRFLHGPILGLTHERLPLKARKEKTC